jgi:hypothetical protein
MKTLSVVFELLHVNRRADRRGEACKFILQLKFVNTPEKVSKLFLIVLY